MEVSSTGAPKVEWHLEGYLALRSVVGSGIVNGLSLEGLEIQSFGEADQIHALGLRAASLPEGFMDWLIRLNSQVGLRFAELGLRAVAQFANGSEALPWSRVHPITLIELGSLECQPGVKYQVDVTGQEPRRLS